MNNIQSEQESKFQKRPIRDKFWLIKIGLVLFFAFFYDIWPFDLIPDIPVLGWGDDLLVTVLSIYYAYKKKKGEL